MVLKFLSNYFDADVKIKEGDQVLSFLVSEYCHDAFRFLFCLFLWRPITVYTTPLHASLSSAGRSYSSLVPRRSFLTRSTHHCLFLVQFLSYRSYVMFDPPFSIRVRPSVSFWFWDFLLCLCVIEYCSRLCICSTFILRSFFFTPITEKLGGPRPHDDHRIVLSVV